MFNQSTNVSVSGVPENFKSIAVRLLLKALQNPQVQEQISSVMSVPSSLQQVSQASNAGMPEKIWAAGNVITDANQKAALPTMLALRSLIEDPQKRNSIQQVLSQLSALAAMPSVGARAADAATRVFNSSNPLEELAEVAPATIAKSVGDLGPSILYQLGQLM